MPQRPNALGLTLCDQVVIEQGTQKPYLLGVFTGMGVGTFPTIPRFDVFAALTDGLGRVTICLSVTHMPTDRVIYAQKQELVFPDALRVMHVRFRVRALTLTEEGDHLFALLIDEEEIAARRVRVYLAETES
jgi:hypothetical protein